MRILIITVLLCLNLSAQNRWEKLNGPVGGAIAGLYAEGDTLVLSTHYDKSSIYYSLNGGNSWQQSNIKIKSRITGIIQVDNNYLAVSRYEGIFKSSDLLNWEKILDSPEDFWSIGMDSKGVIYVGTDRGAIYISKDNGITWEILQDIGTRAVKFMRLSDHLIASTFQNIYIKYDDSKNFTRIKTDSSLSDIGVFVDQQNNLYYYSNFRIYKSSNLGESWTYNESVDFFYANYSYDWIYNNRMIGAFGDQTGLFGSGWGIAVSDDEGATWRWSNEGLPPKFSTVFRLVKSDVNTFAATNAAGVFKSTNFGDSWFPVNNGLNAADVQDLTFDEMGYMYTASWSNGFQRSTDKGETWEVINNGLTNSYCYSIISDDNGILLGSTSQGTFRSLDNGENWKEISFPGYYVYYLRKDNKNRIYALSYGDGLYRTVDYGNSWEKLDKGWISGYVFGLAFDSSGNIYAGTRGGRIYKSTNDGADWMEVYISVTPNSVLNRIVIAENGFIFATSTREGILRSTDGGTTWEIINNGIPWIRASSVGISKKGELFYAVSESTDWNSREKIYYSNDYGNKWDDYTSGLDLIEVRHIIMDDNDDVYLATDEAVWRSNPDSAVTAAEEISVIENYSLYQNYPNPFNPSTKIKYQIPEAGHVTLKVYDILGREAAVLVDKFQSPGEYETEFRAGTLSSGIYFYKLTAGKYTEIKKMQILK